MNLFISAGLDKPLEITSRKDNLKGKIYYSLDVVEKGKKYEISFHNNPDVKGHFRGYLRLGTNYKEKPVITIRIDSLFN